MRLFRLPKRDSRYTDGETPLLRFFRYVLIALLFCGAIWGFWMNNERRMEMLKKPEPMRIDGTGALSDDQQQALVDYQRRFREVYGLNLIIAVRDAPFPEPFLTPDERPGTIFLGLSPGSRQVVFEVPPIAEAALGESLIFYLRQELFVPYFAGDSWPDGLAAGLNMMTRQLDDALLARQTRPAPGPVRSVTVPSGTQ